MCMGVNLDGCGRCVRAMVVVPMCMGVNRWAGSKRWDSMAMSDASGEAPTIDSWQAVAEKTAAIIRVSLLQVFRQAARQVARDRFSPEERLLQGRISFDALRRLAQRC